MRNDSCPVCEMPLSRPFEHSGRGDSFLVDCQRCGQFLCSGLLARTLPNDQSVSQQDRLAFSRAIRRTNDETGRPLGVLLTSASIREIIAGSNVPADFGDQVGDLLLFVASKIKYHGRWTADEPVTTWAGRVGLPNIDDVEALVHAVCHQSNLMQVRPPDRNRATTASLSLTPAGWAEVKRLRSNRAESTRAFIAQWFDPSVLGVFDEHVLPALRAVGLDPYRVDFNDHNDSIDDRIIAAIRSSRVMIADLTGLRGGVYFEAGYAKGLGIPVIWTCNRSWQAHIQALIVANSTTPPTFEKKSWFEGVHFDVRQQNFILWDDPADFQQRLLERLIATGIARTIPPDFLTRRSQ